jgi:hypothetical protein
MIQQEKKERVLVDKENTKFFLSPFSLFSTSKYLLVSFLLSHHLFFHNCVGKITPFFSLAATI